MGHVRKFLKCECDSCYDRRKVAIDELLRRYAELEPWKDVPYEDTPVEIIVKRYTHAMKTVCAFTELDELEKNHREELKRLSTFNFKVNKLIIFNKGWSLWSSGVLLILAFI